MRNSGKTNKVSMLWINIKSIRHRGLWSSGFGRVSLPLPLGFKPQRAHLLPPRCFTCLLGLQGVQWVWKLVVVHVSWSEYPDYEKKKIDTITHLKRNQVPLQLIK